MRVKIMLFILTLFGIFLSERVVAQIVYEERGYDVLDCSGLPETSVKTPAELAASKTVGGRVRRHYAPNTTEFAPSPLRGMIGGMHGSYGMEISERVSQRFALAPVYVSDATGSTLVSWAYASGWALEANTNSDGDTPPAETGCPTYTGTAESPTEAGVWRLPTLREQYLINYHSGQIEVSNSGSSSEAYHPETQPGVVMSSFVFFDHAYDAPFVYIYGTLIKNDEKSTKESAAEYRCIMDL